MTKYRFLCAGLSLVLCLSLLCGCGARQPGEETGQETGSLEKEPELSYEVPELSPHVLVDQVGYESTGSKLAVFIGDDPPEEFKVVDAATRETVYMGTLQRTGESRAQKTVSASEDWPETAVSVGDFTGLTTEGEYYIECDILGRSYTFRISDGVYGKLQTDSLQALKDKRREGLQTEGNNKKSAVTAIDAARTVSALLLSYELYPEETEDTVPRIVAEAAQWADYLTLKQDTETGGVGEASAWFAAAMAKFSYTYQKFDSSYANKCLNAADKAWRYVQKNTGSFADEERFFAAAELYRATGQYQYHKVVQELGGQLTPDASMEALVYGGTTYSATKRKVDIELCEKFLKSMMEEAEEIAREYKATDSLLEGSGKNRTREEILWQMLVVSIVDYVITNHEYATVIENHQHYLMGRNREALCYVRAEGCGNPAMESIWDSPVDTARYIILLREMQT